MVFPFEKLNDVTDAIITQNQQLLLLAGSSASGKSFIAEKIADSLREKGKTVVTISSDDYYSDAVSLQYALYGTFDHPNMIHYDQLGADIEHFLSDGFFDKPNYSFVEKRSTHTTRVEGQYDFVIVEGLYTIDQLGARFPEAMKIFVQASYEEIIFRRIVRDQDRVRESNYVMINNIGKAFPLRNIFGEHQADLADLTITNDYEILDHKGVESKYQLFYGDKDALGTLDYTDHRQHFVYSNEDNNESDIIITEVYRDNDPLLKYIMISAVKEHNETSDHHIDVTLYDPGALTDMHILLQTAGLRVIDRFSTTRFVYRDGEKKNVLLERGGKIYEKIV